MGFLNVARGIRALGYLERYPHPVGPIALVTHSGSLFSSFLRTHRRLEFSLAVSSGQELVTTAADYLDYALDLEETRVVGLVLETIRDSERFRAALERAGNADVPVVLLTAGGSPTGRTLVGAHSGALAGGDGAWEALADAYGVHRVRDLAEMVDTLELFAIGRRPPALDTPALATVHDSGAERVLAADVAHEIGLRFADLGPATAARLRTLLSPGLEPVNPLDAWSTGAQTFELFSGCLNSLADDPAVSAVALAVDLVYEYDQDESYPQAAVAAYDATTKPVSVLANLPSAVDQIRASALRARGIPVLEGTRSGLRAIRHLLEHGSGREHRASAPAVDRRRQERWRERLRAGPLDAQMSFALVADYGIPVVETVLASTVQEAVAAARRIGFPVVLKTADPSIEHKSDVGGVLLGIVDDAATAVAYTELASRLGPRVTVQRQSADGVELAVGMVHDALLGPLVLVAAGGLLVEVMHDRRVMLPPVDECRADRLVAQLAVSRLLDGVRGRPACDRAAVSAAVVAMSTLVDELGDALQALDVNPLVAGPDGVVAVDVLVVPAGAADPAAPDDSAELGGV
jgi:acyl-CoA synthetase (NDP forming)